MPSLATISGLGLVFVNDYLLVFVVGLHLCDDSGAGHVGGAETHFPIARDSQHFIELSRGPFFSGQQLNVKHVAGRDAVLLTTGFYDCIIHR